MLKKKYIWAITYSLHRLLFLIYLAQGHLQLPNYLKQPFTIPFYNFGTDVSTLNSVNGTDDLIT